LIGEKRIAAAGWGRVRTEGHEGGKDCKKCFWEKKKEGHIREGMMYAKNRGRDNEVPILITESR